LLALGGMGMQCVPLVSRSGSSREGNSHAQQHQSLFRSL